MGVCARRIVVPLLIALAGPLAGSALASGPVGADPNSNYPLGSMPAACQTAPTGPVCIDAAVSYLDKARASLGQPPYSLPDDFASLTPAQQALILTNDDRLLYQLAPIAGLTDALSLDAAGSLGSDSDPEPSASDSWAGYTSNASWGAVNMVAAYEGWMYDDGPGSGNVDCTSSDPGECWGHRHDILWQFGPGTLAMGAAAGSDFRDNSAYTMLLMEGSPSYVPAFTYTWAQALADGAGSSSGAESASGAESDSASGLGSSAVSSPSSGAAVEAHGPEATIRVKLMRIRGHRITVRLAGPRGVRLRCFLTRLRGHFTRVKGCSHTVTFSHVPVSRYRLRITSGALTVNRRVRVR